MAHIINEISRTFNEYLLIPGLTTKDCTPANVNLQTPLVKYKKGETPSLSLNVPFTSAIMQSVSDSNMAIALAKNGGISFIYGSQTIDDQAEMVRKVKKYKAGFVVSDANLTPENTLADVVALKQRPAIPQSESPTTALPTASCSASSPAVTTAPHATRKTARSRSL